MKKSEKNTEATMRNAVISAEEATQIAALIQQELEAYIDPIKKEYLPRFFKTGKGQYGEGDKFLGVVVPNTRLVAKQHKDEPFEVMAALLQSEWHECRLCALLMLVERFKKCDENGKKSICEFYLTQTSRINNWDLVDLSAPGIVGEYLKDKPRDVLYRLAESPLLWDQRIAVVSTYTLIKNNDFIDIIRLAEYFLAHNVQGAAHTAETTAHSFAHTPGTIAHSFAHSFPDAHGMHTNLHILGKPLHDLMQKAIGWMLREMGKRDKDLLVQFLEKHSRTMPRTMLRYAIEKFPEDERREFMKR